jgi:hypothetical protein
VLLTSDYQPCPLPGVWVYTRQGCAGCEWGGNVGRCHPLPTVEPPQAGASLSWAILLGLSLVSFPHRYCSGPQTDTKCQEDGVRGLGEMRHFSKNCKHQ